MPPDEGWLRVVEIEIPVISKDAVCHPSLITDASVSSHFISSHLMYTQVPSISKTIDYNPEGMLFLICDVVQEVRDTLGKGSQ